jgi:hypothetical protein
VVGRRRGAGASSARTAGLPLGSAKGEPLQAAGARLRQLGLKTGSFPCGNIASRDESALGLILPQIQFLADKRNS